ncbi:MAG: DUF2281 domain-containing protein [Saprospiraceae bacterium]|nr:DUF2281 domain-containing protein [Saprospiraceae bacterium]
MTITIELQDEEALRLLQNLEKLHILKLIPVPAQTSKKERANSLPLESISSTWPNMKKGLVELPLEMKAHSEDFPKGYGGAKGLFIMSPDFDEPLDDFKEYMY